MLAPAAIEVTPAAATVEGPAEVMASDVLSIRARGPVDGSHWIGFAPAGSEPGAYLEYLRIDDSGSTQGELVAPQAPGNYELRYVLNESEKVVASQPIRVLPARVQLLQPPTTAAAGAALQVDFEGPRAARNWIGVVPRGGGPDAYLTHAHLDGSRSVSLKLPEQAGDYDLVFVLGGELGEQVAARHPLSMR